jgi:hypothetical protein
VAPGMTKMLVAAASNKNQKPAAAARWRRLLSILRCVGGWAQRLDPSIERRPGRVFEAFDMTLGACVCRAPACAVGVVTTQLEPFLVFVF